MADNSRTPLPLQPLAPPLISNYIGRLTRNHFSSVSLVKTSQPWSNQRCWQESQHYVECGGFIMQKRNVLFFGGAMFLSALAGSLIGPRPALAVAREIIELQRDVTSLLQGQKDIQTQMTQDHTVQKTLIEQS